MISSKPTTLPSSLQTGYRIRQCVDARELRWYTYQMTEVLLDHELQRLGRAGGVPGDHRVPRHDMFDSSMVRVNAFRSDLCPVSQHISQKSNLLNLRGMPGPWP